MRSSKYQAMPEVGKDIHLMCSAANVEIYQKAMSHPRKKRNSGTYEVITMVIVGLHPNMDLVGTVSSLFYRLLERLRPQLTILIELVLLTLHARQLQTYHRPNKTALTTSISTFNRVPSGTSHNKHVESHFSPSFTPPCKYLPNALMPHCELVGLSTGAKAEADLYVPNGDGDDDADADVMVRR